LQARVTGFSSVKKRKKGRGGGPPQKTSRGLSPGLRIRESLLLGGGKRKKGPRNDPSPWRDGATIPVSKRVVLGKGKGKPSSLGKYRRKGRADYLESKRGEEKGSPSSRAGAN